VRNILQRGSLRVDLQERRAAQNRTLWRMHVNQCSASIFRDPDRLAWRTGWATKKRIGIRDPGDAQK
jgi:hypothetical protein